jgi:hypothetical protein
MCCDIAARLRLESPWLLRQIAELDAAVAAEANPADTARSSVLSRRRRRTRRRRCPVFSDAAALSTSPMTCRTSRAVSALTSQCSRPRLAMLAAVADRARETT